MTNVTAWILVANMSLLFFVWTCAPYTRLLPVPENLMLNDISFTLCWYFQFTVVMIGSILFGLQQLSGINAVFYFSSAVFKSVGVPSNLANVCVGLSNLTGKYKVQFFNVSTILKYIKWQIYLFICETYILFFAGSIIAMLLMDKLGRKMLLLGSFSGMVDFSVCIKILMSCSASTQEFFPFFLWSSLNNFLL